MNVGDSIFAFKFIAVCVAVDIGLFKSGVLSTSPKPIIPFVIPFTVPVKVDVPEPNDNIGVVDDPFT